MRLYISGYTGFLEGLPAGGFCVTAQAARPSACLLVGTTDSFLRIQESRVNRAEIGKSKLENRQSNIENEKIPWRRLARPSISGIQNETGMSCVFSKFRPLVVVLFPFHNLRPAEPHRTGVLRAAQ